MRTKRALKNLVFSLLSQAVVFLSGFLIPALIIGHYGSTINGLLSSIKQLLFYLAFVETGIAASSVVALYKPLAEGDQETINGIVSATRSFYNKVGLIFLALTAGLAVVYPLMVHDDVPVWLATLMIIIMAGSGVSDFFLLGRYRVMMQAEQKMYVIANIQTVFTLLNVGSAVTLILAGAPIFLVQLISVALYSSRYLAYRYYFRKQYPKVNFHATPKTDLIKSRWDVFIHNISGLTFSNLPILLITLYAPLSTVSVYAVYALVMYAISTLFGVIYSGLLAGFGNMFHMESLDRTRGVFLFFERFYFLLISWVYGCAFLLLLPFVKNYTQGFTDAEYMQPLAAILFVVSAYVVSVKTPALTIMQAAGHFEKTKWGAVVMVVVHLVVSLALVKAYGIPGVLVGALAGAAVRSIELYFYVNHRILKTGALKSFRLMTFNLVLAVAGTFLANLVHVPVKMGWLHWMLDAAIIAPIILIVMLAGNYLVAPHFFREMMTRFRHVLHPEHAEGEA